MAVENNNYGFVWDHKVLVERTASQKEGKTKFWVLRVFAPNGEVIEILMRPRKNRVDIIPREKTEIGI